MARGKTEPRIFTKPLRPLTRETTLGFLFIDFCRDVCGVTLVPWQEWLAVHGLEIVGDLGGDWSFRFRTIVVLVSRQQGKTVFLKLLNLFFMYVLQTPLTLGTAQNLDTAEEAWTSAVDMAEEIEELRSQIEHVSRTNGKKQLKLKTGERYKIVAASRSGGRGNSADLVVMDELREQTNWDAWGAVTKTTMARPNAQVWTFSNAGDASSIVLRTLRAKCHAQCGDPDGVARNIGEMLPDESGVDDSMAIFEWSATPGCDIRDIEALAQANPSLGYGFVTERALMSAASTDPEPVFRTECLCQWVEAVIESAFPDGAWDAGIDPSSSIADGSALTFGIDVSSDRDMASLAVCGKRPDGLWHVEVIARKRGFSWLVDWLRVRAASEPVRVAFQENGAPIAAHIGDIENIQGVECVPCSGKSLGAWTGRFYDSVAAGIGQGDAVRVMHRPQPALDHAARIAQTKALGDSAWTWNRTQSVDDISTLVAATMAFGAATESAKGSRRVYESAYATRSLMVI